MLKDYIEYKLDVFDVNEKCNINKESINALNILTEENAKKNGDYFRERKKKM